MKLKGDQQKRKTEWGRQWQKRMKITWLISWQWDKVTSNTSPQRKALQSYAAPAPNTALDLERETERQSTKQPSLFTHQKTAIQRLPTSSRVQAAKPNPTCDLALTLTRKKLLFLPCCDKQSWDNRENFSKIFALAIMNISVFSPIMRIVL